MSRFTKKVLTILIFGILLGVASSVADLLPFGSFLYMLGGLLNTASVWSISAFYIGSLFRSKRYSISTSIFFLALSVISYYFFGVMWGDRTEIPLITIFYTASSWLIISVFIGSLCGLAGRTAKYSKKIEKRVVAVSVPLIIVLVESFLITSQMIAYLESYIAIMVILVVTLITIVSIIMTFYYLRSKKAALYSVLVSVFIAVLIVILLKALNIESIGL